MLLLSYSENVASIRDAFTSTLHNTPPASLDVKNVHTTAKSAVRFRGSTYSAADYLRFSKGLVRNDITIRGKKGSALNDFRK